MSATFARRKELETPFRLSRLEDVRAKFAQFFPECAGTVSRGKLTALGDALYGPFDLAKDKHHPTKSWRVPSPPSLQCFGFKLAHSPMIQRLDVLAEALFLGGHFNVLSPAFPFRRTYTGERLYDNASMLVLLVHSERRLSATLFLEAETGQEQLGSRGPMLSIHGLGGTALIRIIDLHDKLGAFVGTEFDPNLLDELDRTQAPDLPKKRDGIFDDPRVSFGSLQAAFSWLTRKFRVTDTALANGLTVVG